MVKPSPLCWVMHHVSLLGWVGWHTQHIGQAKPIPWQKGLGWQIQGFKEKNSVEQTHFGHYYDECMTVNRTLRHIKQPLHIVANCGDFCNTNFTFWPKISKKPRNLWHNILFKNIFSKWKKNCLKKITMFHVFTKASIFFDNFIWNNF
jgi:hypothetical protein